MSASGLDSSSSDQDENVESLIPVWLKVGAVAVASALAGGLAAGWFYRKTLHQLQNVEDVDINPDFGREEEAD